MKKKICRQCKKEFELRDQDRNKQFCSVSCRETFYKPKLKEIRQRYWEKHAGLYSDKKCQCLVCGKWFVQVGSHITQRHNMTAREYREYYDLEVKRGILPDWFREIKAEAVFENGTVENLQAGEDYRFFEGDNRAGNYHRSHITIERLKNLKRNSLRKEENET